MRTRRFENDNRNLVLEITQDSLSAYLTIINSNRVIDETEIIHLLHRAGVRSGVAAAAKMMQDGGLEKKFNEPFPIALGEHPQEPGCEFSVMFDYDNCWKEGVTDLQVLSRYEQVEVNTPLAHLFITQQGKEGRNVFGDKLAPLTDSQELLLARLGDNVYHSTDRNQVFSKKAGYPWLDNHGRLHVKCGFTHVGDLTPGPIPYVVHGDLEITGDVKPRVTLKVNGNLHISGSVEGAQIEAGRSLLIHGNIDNCRKGGVVCHGNIKFQSAQNSRIISGKSITFDRSASWCSLIAADTITGEADGAIICGGSAQAGKKIEAGFLGGKDATATELEITMSPWLKEQILATERKLKELAPTQSQKAEQLQTQIDQLKQSLQQQLTKVLVEGDPTPRRITAYKCAYAGLYVRLLKSSWLLDKDEPKVSWSISDNELQTDRF